MRDNEALTATERELFTARRKKRDSALNAVSKEISAAQRQLAVIRPLVKRRAVGEMEMLKLDREIAELSGRQAEIRNTYLQDSYAELADKKSELAALEETSVQRRDQLDRTRLLSPVRGVSTTSPSPSAQSLTMLNLAPASSNPDPIPTTRLQH
ncbi:hypothetical protein C8233_00005 [Halomonas sp. SF2003]|nr:hypothetical protein C8233_00005 [Halomonas sp. SF2003]